MLSTVILRTDQTGCKQTQCLSAGPASIYMEYIKEIWRHFNSACLSLVISENEAIKFKFTSKFFFLST